MGCHGKDVTSKFIDQPYTPAGSIVNIDGQCYIKTGNTGSMTSGVSAQSIPYSTSCEDCNPGPVLQQFTSDFIPDPDDPTKKKTYSQFPVSTRDMLIDNGTITGSNQGSASMGPWTPEEIEIVCDGSPYFGPTDKVDEYPGGYMYREIQIAFASPITVLPGRYIVKACGIKYWWGFKGGVTALYDSGYSWEYRLRHEAGYGIKNPYPGPDGMTTMEKHKYWEDIRDTQRAMHKEAPRPKATPWAYPILYQDAALYYSTQYRNEYGIGTDYPDGEYVSRRIPLATIQHRVGDGVWTDGIIPEKVEGIYRMTIAYTGPLMQFDIENMVYS